MPRSVAFTALMGLAIALGLLIARLSPAPEAPGPLEWLDTPRPVGAFTLLSTQGTFDQRSLAGRWSIVLFGFLQCPDLCPTTMSQLASLGRGLADQPLRDVQLLFVSVDPGRDSVAEVDRYARFFDASILGVTGDPVELEHFASDLGVRFSVSIDGGDYSVAHSVTFSVIDPQGRLHGRFRPGFDAPRLAAQLAAKASQT
ncbi:MAG: SCO family protein [Pseudomonadales bacterium]|nr:SCO family protein [Pseudomonadales bacterium]